MSIFSSGSKQAGSNGNASGLHRFENVENIKFIIVNTSL
jgi:hypothetical protein